MSFTGFNRSSSQSSDIGGAPGGLWRDQPRSVRVGGAYARKSLFQGRNVCFDLDTLSWRWLQDTQVERPTY